MRKPSITFMNRVYAPGRGATGRVLRDLARGFARDGWDVTVITSAPKASKDRDGGVKVVRVKGAEKPANAFSYALVWMKMFVAAMRQKAPHILVTQSDPPLLVFAGRLIAKAKKARHIHWCHDVYPDLFPVLGFSFPSFISDVMDRLTGKALNGADKIIVIGRCMARKIKAKGVNAKSIAMIPNWPDLELAKNHDGGFAGIKGGLAPEKQWYDGAKPFEDQIKDEPKFRVLYAGNIGLAHPIETILDAAEILKADNPEIEFVFVGDGPRFDELAVQRGKRALNNIRLMPYQPLKRLRHVMESGDLHLASLKTDAAGLSVPSKIYAAFAAHRPCVFVGPEESEAARVIQEYKAGTVVPQRNAEDLAVRIKHYRYNGEEWFASQKGAMEAAQIFTPDQAISAWIDRAWAVLKKNHDARGIVRSKPKADEFPLIQDGAVEDSAAKEQEAA